MQHNTFLMRRGAVHRTDLLTHITSGNPQVEQRQSTALSFTDTYLLLGTILLAGLPLLLLSSRKKGKKPVVAMADH